MRKLLSVFSICLCCMTLGIFGTSYGKAQAAEAKKVLVVYYSESGTTKSYAEAIANATNGDLFEITPANPYSSADLNYNDKNSRVSNEHADESLRNVALTKTTPDNWSSYDTVVIGYPIWWGIAAWPVNTFVKGNDFTGKRVIPYGSSWSSDLGESDKLLQALTTTGTWEAGRIFKHRHTPNDAVNWVKELGL